MKSILKVQLKIIIGFTFLSNVNCGPIYNNNLTKFGRLLLESSSDLYTLSDFYLRPNIDNPGSTAQNLRVSGELVSDQNDILSNADLEIYESNNFLTKVNTGNFGKFSLNLGRKDYRIDIYQNNVLINTMSISLSKEPKVQMGNSNLLIQNFNFKNQLDEVEPIKLKEISPIQTSFTLGDYAEVIFKINDPENILNDLELTASNLEDSNPYENQFSLKNENLEIRKGENANEYIIKFLLKNYTLIWSDSLAGITKINLIDSISQTIFQYTFDNTESYYLLNNEKINIRIPTFELIDPTPSSSYDSDPTAPIVHSIQIDKNKYDINEKIRVNFNVTEEETYFSFVTVSLVSQSKRTDYEYIPACDPQRENTCSIFSDGGKLEEDYFILKKGKNKGDYYFDLKIPKYAENNNYILNDFQICSDGCRTLYIKESISPDYYYDNSTRAKSNVTLINLQITGNTSEDITSPKLEYINFDQSTYAYNSLVKVTFKVSDDLSGFDQMVDYYKFNQSSSPGYSSSNIEAIPTENENEYYFMFDTGTTVYTQLYLSSFYFYDKACNKAQYKVNNSSDTYFSEYNLETKTYDPSNILVPKASFLPQ